MGDLINELIALFKDQLRDDNNQAIFRRIDTMQSAQMSTAMELKFTDFPTLIIIEGTSPRQPSPIANSVRRLYNVIFRMAFLNVRQKYHRVEKPLNVYDIINRMEKLLAQNKKFPVTPANQPQVNPTVAAGVQPQLDVTPLEVDILSDTKGNIPEVYDVSVQFYSDYLWTGSENNQADYINIRDQVAVDNFF